MLAPTRSLFLVAALWGCGVARAAEPDRPQGESPALHAAQARLDAATKEVADLLAKESGSPNAPAQIELRVTRGAADQRGEVGSPGDRIERRIIVMTPEEVDGSSVHKMPLGPPGPHFGMHGPFPEGMRPRGPLGDLELATLSPGLGRYFGTTSGVLVTRASAGSGLEDGDVIVSIHGRIVVEADHARRILETYGPAEPAPVVVLRDHKTVELRLQAIRRKEMGDH